MFCKIDGKLNVNNFLLNIGVFSQGIRIEKKLLCICVVSFHRYFPNFIHVFSFPSSQCVGVMIKGLCM